VVVIKGNGNVGIGTTSPGDRLHVAGNIKNLNTYDVGGKHGRKTITTQTALADFTQDLLTVSPASLTTLMIRVTAIQGAYASANGNVHIGAAFYLSGTGGSVTTMQVQSGTVVGGSTNVGTLSWSGTTLRYTSNRISNYDYITMIVELVGEAGLSSF
jgi:hypothetical protein